MELERFLEISLEGVSIEEVRDAGGIDMDAAEKFLIEHPKYVDGIPFPGDDADFDQFMRDRNPGAMALQEIFNRFDDPIDISEYDKA